MPGLKRRLERAWLEGVEIRWRNFKGEVSDFNPMGKRQFAVMLDEQQADQMAADGWNVKFTKPKDPEEEPEPYIRVEVSYKNADERGGRAPQVYLVAPPTKDGVPPKTTELPREMLRIADQVDVHHADVLLEPYRWDVQGNQGVKAYLYTIGIAIKLDPFMVKYKIGGNDMLSGASLAIESGEEIIDGEVIDEEIHEEEPPF